MSQQPVIVFATDVRFWHRSTGAQQRIAALVDHLSQNGFRVTTLFLSALHDEGADRFARQERDEIARQNLDVRSVLDDWRPVGWRARAVWQIQCIANAIARGLGGAMRSPNVKPDEAARGGHTLQKLPDFVSPLLRRRFRQMVAALDPQVVIVEYVTLAWLVPPRRPDRPSYWVDTHDLLSERCSQFRKHGYDHWIDITADEEAAALARFDVAVAIQQQEASALRAMLADSGVEVIVAGHPGRPARPATVQETLNAGFTLGYFGSDNPSNVHAMGWFLEKVWPAVRAGQPTWTCLVAGTICRTLRGHGAPPPGITLQPDVPDRDLLYRSFRVAINPVQFGTGLKIKNQEALAYGKPLLVTRSGAAGMPNAEGHPAIRICHSPGEMSHAILEIAGSDEQLRKAAEAALRYAADHLSGDVVFGELVAKLRQTGG